MAPPALVAQPLPQGPSVAAANPVAAPAPMAAPASVGNSSPLRPLGTPTPGGGAYYADANNQVFQWDGAQWHYQSQGSVAPDSSFWFLAGTSGGSTSAPLYRSVNGQVQQQYGSWTGLLGVTSDGSVWVTQGSQVIRGASNTGWTDQTSGPAAGLAQASGLGAAITANARQYLGQTDPPGSRGECTDLVMAALQESGAATTLNFGVTGPDANYVWGTLVAEHSGPASGQDDGSNPLPVQAGDIIQFRDVAVVNHTTGPDGTTWTQTLNMDHHTAIIEAALGGGSYRILEENWDGGKPDGRVVRESTINLNDMTQGQYWIYQPVPV